MNIAGTTAGRAGLVLVVEDDAATNEIVCLALSRDHQVVSAYDGADGLSKALELAPDVIVTDLTMPAAVRVAARDHGTRRPASVGGRVAPSTERGAADRALTGRAAAP